MHQFVEECRMNLNLIRIPEAELGREIPKRKEEKDGFDELLDILEKVLIPIPIPGPPVPIPLPLIVGVVKTLKKWIFGSGNGEVPDVEEWNRQQEEYAQERTMALRELKNQISIQMADYRERISTVFTEQLENVYCESVAEIDGTLKEMEGKNQSRMQRQEKLAELKTKAERLLKEIRSGK